MQFEFNTYPIELSLTILRYYTKILLLAPWRGLRDQLTFVYHNLEAVAIPRSLLGTVEYVVWKKIQKRNFFQALTCLSFKLSAEKTGGSWAVVFLLVVKFVQIKNLLLSPLSLTKQGFVREAFGTKFSGCLFERDHFRLSCGIPIQVMCQCLLLQKYGIGVLYLFKDSP